MTSLATFQPYVDKENADVHPKNVDRSRIGLGGKVFQSSSHSISTPRAVLKDVNQGLSGNRQELGNKSMKPPVNSLFKKAAPFSSHPTPAKKKELKIHSDTSKKQKQVVTVQPDKPIKKPEAVPPRENMHIYSESEEVRPRMDIDFRGVIGMLNKWRPPCWFGSRSDSDSDDDEGTREERRRAKLLSDCDVPEGEPIPVPEENMFTADDLLDMPIPFIDEDIPLPFMDDSIDIEPNMGTLEIWDINSIPTTPEKSIDSSP